MNKRIVALLPMKANSERVNGKNFKDFHGKPLFRWILDTLLGISEIDQVVINTDARSILQNHGLVDESRVLIRDRKESIQGDYVSMNKIIEDDVNSIAADYYFMTHTTNPLLSQSTIREAMMQLKMADEDGSADSIFTVNKIQTRFYNSDVEPINHDPKNLIRTQDLVPWFEENSCLYGFTKDSFGSTKARIGKKPKMLVTSKFESIDIDEPDDWEFALAAAKLNRGDSNA